MMTFAQRVLDECRNCKVTVRVPLGLMEDDITGILIGAGADYLIVQTAHTHEIVNTAHVLSVVSHGKKKGTA